ncbi:flavodoxin domain-containing protein [Blastococcus sp. SYSU DS0533]
MTHLLATSPRAPVHTSPPGTGELLAPPTAGPGGGPRVLVVFASRHGSTREIAAELVRALPGSAPGRSGGLSATLAPVEMHPDPAGFDAVVLGSAVYAGRWLEPARRYVDAVAPQLRARPTWLFSSGLAGNRPWCPDGADRDARSLGELTGARGYRAFGGRLERRLLSAAERRDWPAGGATGDLRDWRAVRGWAGEIAEAVARQAVPLPG